jgi:hypothetical protein
MVHYLTYRRVPSQKLSEIEGYATAFKITYDKATMTDPRKILALILIMMMSLGTASHGTAQKPDKIIYQGKTYDLHSNPLETYFDKYPNKRPQGVISSNLWRGYIATFEIIDNCLYLIDIKSLRHKDNQSETVWRSVFQEIFQGYNKVKVDWFNGLLVIPHGRMTKFVNTGYASLFEHYFILEIERSDLKKEKRLGGAAFQAFKDRQFEQFKKTDEYERLVGVLKKERRGDSISVDKFLKESILQYSPRILTD